MRPNALAHVLAQVDWYEASPPTPRAAPIRTRRTPPLPEGLTLPAALGDCDVGAWRWFGPGIRISRIRAPADPKANLMMLRVGPGLKLPVHAHTGVEYTHVLYGSFTDERGRYAPGDLDEADADVNHQPVVDPDGECICLASIDGRMRPRDMIVRLLQPLVGI
jgi:putative transcriptional regulator